LAWSNGRVYGLPIFRVSYSDIFQVAAKGLSTKKRGLVFSMLILSGAIAAIFYSQKPGDSDVWWYGAIAGFLACLLLAFLVLIGFLFFKLKTKERIQA